MYMHYSSPVCGIQVCVHYITPCHILAELDMLHNKQDILGA